MKISILAVILSLASATSTLAAKQEQDVIADKQQEQHRSLDVKIYIESMGTADGYKYASDLICQSSFCDGFSDKCFLSGGPDEALAYASYSSTYCRVFLDDGVELTCTEQCVDPGPPASPSNNLPTREFQIKDLLFSQGPNYCLEVQTDATTGLPSDASDVFETMCDGVLLKSGLSDQPSMRTVAFQYLLSALLLMRTFAWIWRDVQEGICMYKAAKTPIHSTKNLIPTFTR